MKKVIEVCPNCDNYFPRLWDDNIFICDECGEQWENIEENE